MEKRNRQVKTRFGPETRFEFSAIPPVPFRGASENELELLKTRLLAQLQERAADAEMSDALGRAAHEAASLAWFTPFPLLVFPVLFQEKAEAIQRQEARQRDIRQRSRTLLDQATI